MWSSSKTMMFFSIIIIIKITAFFGILRWASRAAPGISCPWATFGSRRENRTPGSSAVWTPAFHQSPWRQTASCHVVIGEKHHESHPTSSDFVQFSMAPMVQSFWPITGQHHLSSISSLLRSWWGDSPASTKTSGSMVFQSKNIGSFLVSSLSYLVPKSSSKSCWNWHPIIQSSTWSKLHQLCW